MNTIETLYTKLFKPSFYKAMKKEARREAKRNEFYNKLRELGSCELRFPQKDSYTFKHSGHSGDIIYSLPTIYALAKKFGSGKANILIQLNAYSGYDSVEEHPNGKFMIPQKVFEMFVPLLEVQPGISAVDIYTDQPVDCDMDSFREFPLIFEMGDIAKWYTYLYPVDVDTSKPWIVVEPNPVAENAIVVARSSRYNSKNIDHSFLSQYPTVYFVGLENEFREMQKKITGIQWLETKNFKDLAEIIAGAKLFIGNQSFPFSLAEALKVPRLLEVFFECPNVNPVGGLSAMFFLQNRFEFLTRSFWESDGKMYGATAKSDN